MGDASELAASRIFFVLSKIGCPTTPLIYRPPGLSMKFANAMMTQVRVTSPKRLERE
jgi:hypothetical protein